MVAISQSPTKRIRRSVLGAILLAFVFVLDGSPVKAAPSSAAAPATEVEPAAIILTSLLAEPPVATTRTTVDEDRALNDALSAHTRRADPDDASALARFLDRYPRSGWSAALWTNLGLSTLHDGFYSQAIDDFRKAWALGKNATDPRAKAMVDRAVGELARLYKSFGQFENLKSLFAEIGSRPISGSATEAVQGAREALTLVNNHPTYSF